MKLFLSITLSFLIFSCQQAPTTSTDEDKADPMMETYAKNVESVKQMFAAFSEKDLDKMKTLISDDFIWSPPGYGMDSLPIPQWEESMQGFMTNYNDIKYENPLYFAGLGDDQKPDGGVRTYGNWISIYVPNGKESAVKYYSVFQFNDDGKMIHQMEWYNSSDLVPED